jgi:hypothetical protein
MALLGFNGSVREVRNNVRVSTIGLTRDRSTDSTKAPRTRESARVATCASRDSARFTWRVVDPARRLEKVRNRGKWLRITMIRILDFVRAARPACHVLRARAEERRFDVETGTDRPCARTFLPALHSSSPQARCAAARHSHNRRARVDPCRSTPGWCGRLVRARRSLSPIPIPRIQNEGSRPEPRGRWGARLRRPKRECVWGRNYHRRRVPRRRRCRTGGSPTTWYSITLTPFIPSPAAPSHRSSLNN